MELIRTWTLNGWLRSAASPGVRAVGDGVSSRRRIAVHVAETRAKHSGHRLRAVGIATGTTASSIVGEEVESCGWKGAIEEAVGRTGTVEVAELIEEGNVAIFGGKYGRNGRLAAWQWTYTHETPDGSYDAILVAQAAQHCDDSPKAARKFVRVSKPGKRIVSAEALIPEQERDRSR